MGTAHEITAEIIAIAAELASSGPYLGTFGTGSEQALEMLLEDPALEWADDDERGNLIVGAVAVLTYRPVAEVAEALEEILF